MARKPRAAAGAGASASNAKGAPASDKEQAGPPASSSSGDAPGTVALQGSSSPPSGTPDGQTVPPEGDKAKAADPAPPPEPTRDFITLSSVLHDGRHIGAGTRITLTRAQQADLKAAGAVAGTWTGTWTDT